MSFIRSLWARALRLSLTYKIVGGVVFVAVVLIGGRVLLRPAATESAQQISVVHIASVASLSDQSGPLPVVGKVSSVSKANILAVSSGEVVSLVHALGDYVYAGAVIGNFENSSQRAAVLQAEGAYEAAQAAASKATGSTAQNSSVSSAQATQAAQNAAVSANAAIRSLYAALDDAVHTKADTIFSNPRSNLPLLNVSVPDGQLVIDIQNTRTGLDTLLQGVNGLDTSSTQNLDAHIATTLAAANTVSGFLGDLIDALNKAVPSITVSATTIASYQTTAAAARTEVLSAVATLNNAKSTYDSALSAAAEAQTSASSGITSDIAAAQANVKTALGSLNVAQANLEKTIIRSPISGTIVSLPIHRGDYVASFSQVAAVSNPGALEVDAYITSDDAKTIAIGGKATINGSGKGTIVFIAPALDPSTGKIEVKIGIAGQAGVTDGEVVSVTLERTLGTHSAQAPVLIIPLAAVKITPQGSVVFTVASSTLHAQAIVLGEVLGNSVAIQSGISAEEAIVTDARGLSDGQEVSIAQ